MALYRRGNIWWCRWRIGGAEVRESAGTADRAQAQEYHDRRRADLWRADRLGERRTDWDQAALAWIEEHAHAKRSYSDDLLKLRWLQPRLTGRDLAAITPELLREIAAAKIAEGRTASTANKHLATISAVLRFAARKGWLRSVPWVPYLPAKSERIAWITREQASALLAELPDHLEAMARFTLATGLRRSNVTGLEWANVDLGRRVAWIWPDEAKAGKSIAVPLNDDAVAVLQGQIGEHERWVFTWRGKPVFHTKTKAWDAAVARAGIAPGVRWHDLRHTWATWHVMAGTPLEVLMKLGGWSSHAMVLRYAHFAPGYLAEYADRLKMRTEAGTVAISRSVEEGAIFERGVADGIRTHDNRNHKAMARPTASNVLKLHQALTAELRGKRRAGKV